MTGHTTILFAAAGVLAVLSSTLAWAAEFRWQTAKPESVGMSSEKLAALRESLARKGTDCLLVVRHDRIVLEWYAPEFSADKPHYLASLSKSMVGGMTLVVVLADGRIAIDDPAWKYIPQWKDDPIKSKITVRHLASHSSGLDDTGERTPGTFKERFWNWPDHYVVARDLTLMLFEPGKGYHYSNPGMAMLAYCVASAIKDAPTPDVREMLSQRVMKPIGAADGWAISTYGGGKPVEIDGLRVYANWGGGMSTARVAARVGRLMLRQGDWDGTEVLPRRWVETMLRDAGGPAPDRKTDPAQPRSGLCWWLNVDGVWKGVPTDAFAGAGAQNQVLFVVPSLDLIAVRFGKTDVGREFWQGLYQEMFAPLVAAVAEGVPAESRAPYPPSPVLAGIQWAPASQIVHQAIDSDNWPITWGDDDAQYTSYGDGWGFDPRTEKKLSQGLAKIVGGATGFTGVNIRSETGETVGDGAGGAKASGMLMVNGMLYMLVRNTGNSQLAWSSDRGKNWTWADWRFAISFGCPTFLNFGRNYAGARDDYVYVYSQDGPSAYDAYDGVVLARVRKDRIVRRDAYEFFAGLDGNGKPTWSPDIERRGHVFVNRGRCRRMDVVYHPVLKRYLLAQGFDDAGGWGIFDAPEPWGPWTTVFTTDDWGLGAVHGYRIPAKWLGADGKTFYVVFSGRVHQGVSYDAFCVREGTFRLR